MAAIAVVHRTGGSQGLAHAGIFVVVGFDQARDRVTALQTHHRRRCGGRDRGIVLLCVGHSRNRQGSRVDLTGVRPCERHLVVVPGIAVAHRARGCQRQR